MKQPVLKAQRGRWSAQAKRAAVFRLLRGEDTQVLAVELGVAAAKLSCWRETYLALGEPGLHALARPASQRGAQRPWHRNRAHDDRRVT